MPNPVYDEPNPEDRTYLLLCEGPGPFDTLEKLEQHLKEMRQLPDGVVNKQMLIEDAEGLIQRKRLRAFTTVVSILTDLGWGSDATVRDHASEPDGMI